MADTLGTVWNLAENSGEISRLRTYLVISSGYGDLFCLMEFLHDGIERFDTYVPDDGREIRDAILTKPGISLRQLVHAAVRKEAFSTRVLEASDSD